MVPVLLLLFLLLLLLLLPPAVPLSCSPIAPIVNDSRRPLHCVGATARGSWPFAASLDSGSCLVCGDAQQPRAAAAFRLEGSASRRLLLFRSHSASGVLVYDTFTSGPSNASAQRVEELAASQSWYRSPLTDAAHVLGAQEVQLELLDYNGSLVVRLGFKLTGSPTAAGSWFTKDLLLSALPWDVAAMKTHSYNYFSMQGAVDSSATRRFYINKLHNYCPNDEGYLALVMKSYCPWDIAPAADRPYLWTIGGGKWSEQRREAVVLQIFAVFGANSTTRVYARR